MSDKKFDLEKVAKGDHQYETRERNIVERGTIRNVDIIAPDALEVDVNYIKIGNRYNRTVMVTGYPRTARIGWLNRLYSYGANIDISMHVEPLQTDKVIKSLNKKIGQYISTQRMDAEKGKISDITVSTAKNDAEVLRDALHKGREKLFYQTIYINISAKSMDELDNVTEDIESLCGGMGMTTRHAMFQQEQAFKSCLPIAEDRVRFRRNFDTSSLATCFPIVSAELTSTKGTPILYGLNMINGSLVLFDRFSLPNYNSITLATSGAGKSYFVKLEAIRYLALGANVIIIDPQGEYRRIAEALGGQYIKISATSQQRINIFDLEYGKDIRTNGQEDEEEMNFLQRKILDLVAVIEVMIKRTLTAKERTVVLDAIESTYARFGITRDNKKSVLNSDLQLGEFIKLETNKKEMPTLTDLSQSLRRLGEHGENVADELEPFVTGVLNFFNGETNIDTNSNFIVFDIKDMEKEMGEIAMFICLEFIWNKIKSGDMKKRLLIVDEAWMLMAKEQSADFVIRVAKTARKFNAGLSIISQQVRDFLGNKGEGIVGNCSMQVLLKQSDKDLTDLGSMFRLSLNEQGILRTARKGEALIFAGQNRTLVKVISHEFEHILCTTDPKDLERIRDLLKD